MNRSHVQTQRITIRVAGQYGPQCRDGIGTLFGDQQALGGHAPEHVVVGQGIHQCFSVGISQIQRLILGGVFGHQPVDPTPLPVPQRVDVGIALTFFGIKTGGFFGGNRVVLDDEVVPVGHPQVAVGAHVHLHRREPLIGTAQNRTTVFGFVPDAIGLRVDKKLTEQVRGGFAHKGAAVPELFREGSRRVEAQPGTGSVTAVEVHLKEVIGRRENVGKVISQCGQPGNHVFIFTVNVAAPQRHVENRRIIGSGAEHFEVFTERQTPGVVIELADRLDIGAIQIHPVDAILEGLTVFIFRRFRVAHCAPKAIVVAVFQVRWSGVSVPGAPSGIEDFADIGLAIAVGVFQKQEVRRLGYHKTAVERGNTGGHAQLVGKHFAAIGPAVAVGIDTHTDAVIASAVFRLIVGVVDGLQHEQATLLIPGKGDGVDDIRLTDKQLQFKAFRHHGQGHGVFHAQRFLEFGGWLNTTVVGNGTRFFIGGFGQGFYQRAVGFTLLLAHGPEDAANQQVVKFRLTPGAFVVTIGGVEHPAFTLLTGPGPGLFLALHQHGAVFFVVIGVNVGFIPGFKGLETFHDRMVFLTRCNGRGEFTGTVTLEASTDQIDKGVGMAEAGAGTVDGQERTALFHEAQQCRFPLGGQFVVVGVQHDRIHIGQPFIAQPIQIFHVFHEDLFTAQRLIEQGRVAVGHVNAIAFAVAMANEQKIDHAVLRRLSIAGDRCISIAA